MSTIEPPARAVWFDLASRTERVIEPGEPVPEPDASGFLWLDLELPSPNAVAALVEEGILPAGALAEDTAAGDVGWTVERDHVHLRLAGARMQDESLRLDRRRVLVTEHVVASLHRGLPRHFDELRARYHDDFARFARSRGFLVFQICSQLVDDLQGAVRGLGDRIDHLRVSTARTARQLEADAGSELLSSVLLMRRILVRTRDVLAEVSSRRTTFVPETTQPFLRDMANRLDGLLADLAFSRDVLSEALRAADVSGAIPQSADAPSPAVSRRPAPPTRPPLRLRSLGGFDVMRGDEPIPYAAFGRGPARELLAALLCARRAVPGEELISWLWPELQGERATRALRVAVSALRHALEPERATGGRSALIVSQSGSYRVVLGDEDTWDVDELLTAASRAATAIEPSERLDLLAPALEVYRGPLYPEWPYAEWSTALREQCEQAHVAVRAALADALVQTGRPNEALAHFEVLLAADPEHEGWHRGVMRCHFEGGDRALALRQFHTCRSVLRQSQGVEPSPETQSLYLELLKRA